MEWAQKVKYETDSTLERMSCFEKKAKKWKVNEARNKTTFPFGIFCPKFSHPSTYVKWGICRFIVPQHTIQWFPFTAPSSRLFSKSLTQEVSLECGVMDGAISHCRLWLMACNSLFDDTILPFLFWMVNTKSYLRNCIQIKKQLYLYALMPIKRKSKRHSCEGGLPAPPYLCVLLQNMLTYICSVCVFFFVKFH